MSQTALNIIEEEFIRLHEEEKGRSHDYLMATYFFDELKERIVARLKQLDVEREGK